jgi:hypothetical protein
MKIRYLMAGITMINRINRVTAMRQVQSPRQMQIRGFSLNKFLRMLLGPRDIPALSEPPLI